MDAPPDREDSRPFVKVARLFGAAGVTTPQIIAEDLPRGFLLLSDLGQTTYLQALEAGASAEPLYRDALDSLVRIQAATHAAALPAYDRAACWPKCGCFPTGTCTAPAGRASSRTNGSRWSAYSRR